MRKNITPKAAIAARDNRNTLDAAGIAATVPAASSGSPANPQGSRPNLLDAIAAYRAGHAAFAAIKEADWPAHGGEQAVVEKTYGPAFDVMTDWDRPASNEEEAIAALHAAQDNEDEFRGSDITSAMLRAALAYFDGRENIRDDGPLSLKPSADIDFAMKALSYLEERKDEVWSQVSVYENEMRDGRFVGNYDGWKKWVKTTPHPFLQSQHQALCDLAIAMEKFVRARECQTVGDLLAKVQLNAFWMKDDIDEMIENYGDESCLMIQSILPLVERLGGNSGEGV